ncbi:unnamed protein product [Bursaphelenchus xylophilus]|uniref:CAAX prenyl protease 2 n=1 Tax=Bursaphelenchus xylophilus TaxID=6326 RepID=A0A1I7RNR0_BURXY|nr:unnamed protein product [Bursaphelenchus xylophilus]CAG9124230.1 unnamed protein product [Bursaphelenchus xylophilus]
MSLKWLYVPTALSIPFIYVGSLYVLDKEHQLHSDHPSTIRKRFIRVTISTSITVATTYLVLSQEFYSPLRTMGIYVNGDTASLCGQSVLLTATVYLGTFIMDILDGSLTLRSVFALDEWIGCFKDLIWLRNNIMAPITEELAFRSCAAVLIRHSLGDNPAIFFSPLLFALSHYHHLKNDIHHGQSIANALVTRSVQALYTYLFGVYVTFLSFKYDQVLPIILSHALCNNTGLPRVTDIEYYPQRQRKWLGLAHLTGLGLFVYGICRMTN